MPNADPGLVPAGQSTTAGFSRRQRAAVPDNPAITMASCAGGKDFPSPWPDPLVAGPPAPRAGQLATSGHALLPGPRHGRTGQTWVAVPAQGRGQRDRLAQGARAFAAG